MIKNMMPSLILGWVIKVIFVEAVVLSVVWFLNTLLMTSISYFIVGGVVGVLFVLGLIYSLFVINTGKKTFADIKSDFDNL